MVRFITLVLNSILICLSKYLDFVFLVDSRSHIARLCSFASYTRFLSVDCWRNIVAIIWSSFNFELFLYFWVCFQVHVFFSFPSVIIVVFDILFVTQHAFSISSKKLIVSIDESSACFGRFKLSAYYGRFVPLRLGS